MDEYNNEQIKKFDLLCKKLCDVDEEIDNLKVGDMEPYLIGKLVLKVLASINEYEEYAKKYPKKFKENFNFDVRGLEIKISYLQRDYLED